MALLDVSDLMLDPDFADTLQLITQSVTFNNFGEPVYTQTTIDIVAIVQQGTSDDLARLPEGAKLTEVISVFYKGVLTAESPGGYTDIIVWKGLNYQVKNVTEPYSHYGGGFTKALCVLEPAHV